jgi:GWxTD domain-containing protein
MKTILYSILWVMIFIAGIRSQSTFIPLSVEHALFRGAEHQAYLEVYLSFYENFLTYILRENKYLAEYIALAEIIQNDSLLERKVDRRISEIDTSRTTVNIRKFINVFKFYLEAGTYTVKIQVQDQNSPKSGEYEFDLAVKSFSATDLVMSDIQLCSKITPDTAKTEFMKNSFLTLPNPENLFSLSLPVVYYYAELYNLSYDPAEPGNYLVQASITDDQGKIIKEYSSKRYKKPGESSVIVGGHNVVTLPPATYYLNLEVKDEQTQVTIRDSKKFSFYKPTEKTYSLDDSLITFSKGAINIGIFVDYNEEQLDKEFAQAEYLSTKEERKIFKNLDQEGKKYFLARFWKKFDSDPQTDLNEFRKQYLELVDYADKNYGAMRKDGWKTDRGRVLLTYGIPSEIQRYYMEIDKKPHEIWQYQQLEGGVIFVFADLTGFGEFDLIHSTYSRELHQPAWERLVSKTPGGVVDTEQQY